MPRKLKKTDYKKITSKLIKEKLTYFLTGFTIFFLMFVTSILLFKKTNILGFIVKKENIKPNKKELLFDKNIRVYEIKEGDFLWKIAEEQYGSGFNAYDIAQVNKLIDPNNLQSGQKLILPNISPKVNTTGEISSIKTDQVKSPGSTYIVKEGDFLSQIALEVYGDWHMVDKIIKANKINNPEIIEPGTVLVIPR